ncbi:MAG: ThuA domain-containing protein [Verrucomicrobiota bacterium]
MKKFSQRSWFRFLSMAILCGLLLPAWAAPKRVLVVTVTKGFRHSSIPTAEKVLGELGEKSGAFTVDYVRNDAEMAEKMTLANLEKYDGVIFANTTGDLPLPDKTGFLKWIESGKGFIGMHSATDTFRGHKPLDAYTLMIGGEFLTHDAQVGVDCLNQDHQHPATKHLGDKFSIFDEIYILNGFERAKVHGLLTLDKHPNSGAPGDYPIAWCKNYGKGRVFYTSLGHREDVWDPAWKDQKGNRQNSPEIAQAYQQHILNGIKWALGLEKGDATPQSTKAVLSDKEAREGFKPLFNGVDLTGWKLRNPSGQPSWSAQNGMLVNTIGKNEHGTDLVSEEQFRDFTIRYEYMIPKGSNSGLYLRGRHEVQIFDDFGTGETKMGGNGAIYSVKPASQNVSRKPGEWQQGEATIIGNKVTVTLNGVKIHDNVEVNKATGGELDGNLDQPGPIMLQGDHGAIAFRNVRIKKLK